MAEWFVDILRNYPPLALFLTIGLGFLIGRIRFGRFQLGSVTSVLLVGVLVGQLNIPMSGLIKQFFFMLFLFSIGYTVGPDFFKSLKGSGAKQALFAVIMSSVCFMTTLGISFLFSYSQGETVGLFSGSQTCSALLGVGSEAIQKLGYPPDVLSRELGIIPVCYAVTYIFGTLGTVILLGNFGPKLLGGLDYVKARTAELEEKLGKLAVDEDPAVLSNRGNVSYRTYIIDNPYFDTPRTVAETESYFRSFGLDVYVDCHSQTRGEGEDQRQAIVSPEYDDLLCNGERVAICGRNEYMVEVEKYLGRETDDKELLSYPVVRVGIRVASKEFIDKPLTKLRGKRFMRGVVVRDATRGGRSLSIDRDRTFRKGDLLTVIGREENVYSAASHIGHLDRPSDTSDLMFVGLAIFIGGFFGAITFWVKSVPLSFGTSGGALIAGLVFGWLRSRRPTYGHISRGALWVMNNLGLNVFIAVVGIESAPSFVAGIRDVGVMLFVAGIIATLIPLLTGLWLGQKVFKFNPAITLGCCAGTRTCTAALGAVQTSLGSPLPAIGYTVTYAVSNILLVVWGLLTVLLVP